jgi:tRNA(Arg) A34 adenosine deaminase TadA
MEFARHEHWMAQAIQVARQNPRAPFGAIMVHQPTGSVLASGVNHTADSPIWHGEMDALGKLARDIDFARCVLYSTAEPCPMCQSALCWAGVGTVVYGTSIPFLQSLGWDQIDLRAQQVADRSHRPCHLLGGVLGPECDRLFLQARPGAI